MFPTVHHWEFVCVQRNLNYYPGIFYQLVYTNEHFLNATLVLSHLHTHTHTNTHIRITEGFIFISEYLSIKPGIWISQ